MTYRRDNPVVRKLMEGASGPNFNALLQVAAGRRKFASIIQGAPKHPVCLQHEPGVVLALGLSEQLFPKLQGRWVLRPPKMINIQPEKHLSKLGRVAHLLTNLTSAGISPGRFRCRITLGKAIGDLDDDRPVGRRDIA